MHIVLRFTENELARASSSSCYKRTSSDLRRKVVLKYYQVAAWVLARLVRLNWLRPLDLTVAALQLPSCCGVSHDFAKREAPGLYEQFEWYNMSTFFSSNNHFTPYSLNLSHKPSISPSPPPSYNI